MFEKNCEKISECFSESINKNNFSEFSDSPNLRVTLKTMLGKKTVVKFLYVS